MRKLDISLGTIMGMLALGIGSVASRHLPGGDFAGVIIMIAFLLGCWLIILIVEGREKNEEQKIQKKNGKINRSGEQYSISLSQDIIDLTGWDEKTALIVVPYIGNPESPITPDTPLLIKKIQPKNQEA